MFRQLCAKLADLPFERIHGLQGFNDSRDLSQLPCNQGHISRCARPAMEDSNPEGWVPVLPDSCGWNVHIVWEGGVDVAYLALTHIPGQAKKYVSVPVRLSQKVTITALQ